MKKITMLLGIILSGGYFSVFGQKMTMKMDDKSMTSDKGKTGYPVTGKIRTYYIAADEVAWDYMPGNTDPMTGKPVEGVVKLLTEQGPTRIGKVYVKAIYREYTDSTFTKLKPRKPDEQYLGLLGPVLRAEVGDVFHIVFKNNATIPYDMHPHGVFYDKASEGAVYDKDNGENSHDGNAVPPGGRFTYVWKVPERAGPGPNDGSSVVWFYHSHVNEPKDVNSGLVGAIIITAKGKANPDGTPKDVDREFISLYMIFDENSSWYLDQNVRTYCGITNQDSINKLEAQVLRPDSILAIEKENKASSFVPTGFIGTNFRFTINGFSFGSMPMMTMKKGEHVRWYLLALGNGFNFHTPHWHGNVVTYNGQHTDVVALSPAQMAVADMVPDNVGVWMYHCHVDDHMEGGMMAMYQVVE